MNFIVPAVLPASQRDLENKLMLFARLPGVERVQIDVVDGIFAAPASWPYSAPNELHNRVLQNVMLPNLHNFEYEIDLMCLDGERAAESWLALGASRLTFHVESTANLSRLLSTFRVRSGSRLTQSRFISVGLALNVESPLTLIEPYLEQIDYVQFMGIAHIGRQGEPFDQRTLARVTEFHTRHPDIAIQIDGGVSLESGEQLAKLGVSNLIVGSRIVHADDPIAAFEHLEALQTSYGV